MLANKEDANPVNLMNATASLFTSFRLGSPFDRFIDRLDPRG